MSSFICSNKHFASIAKGIVCIIKTNSFHVSFSLKQIAPQIYSYKRTLNEQSAIKEVNSFIDTLMELQVLCVSLQYRHHYEGHLDQEISEQREILHIPCENPVSLSPVALYKSIHCALYQIETEHLEELRPLTSREKDCLTFFRLFANNIADYIIKHLPEYDKVPWTI
ncbi:hypothetical protein [Parabacteroides sp.]